MTKYLLIPIIIFFLKQERPTPLGDFKYRTNYERYNLTLNKDSSFVQENGGCTWHYIAKGKWKTNLDTIKLIADKIYTVDSKGKKLIKKHDKSLDAYIEFYRYNECVVKNEDTLIQLIRYDDGSRHERLRLKRSNGAN